MRHTIGTVFAIGLAGVAAVAATTAYLNSPLRIGPAPTNTPASPPATTPPGQTPAPEPPADAPAPTGGAKPTPAEIPDAPQRGASAPAPEAAKPAAEGEKPDEDDKDPYEGIAPEELPPDLQYDADSSVSFPTNI